jgi:hypothetical protein
MGRAVDLRFRRKLTVLLLADRARDARQWELAAQLYREGLDRIPWNPPIWVQYGHALKESGELRDPGKLAQAEIAYRTALSLDPGAADTYLQLGHVLKLQSKTEEAQAAYLRAFSLDPASPHPLEELSELGWSEVNLSELRILGSGAPDASLAAQKGSASDVVSAPPELPLVTAESLDRPISALCTAEQNLDVAEDVAHRVLVADYRIPMADVSAGEWATVGLISDLYALGYDVTFLSYDLVPSPKYETELRAKGVTVVTRAHGYESAVDYLSQQGHSFGLFYLIRLDVAEAAMKKVREVARDARVIFHSPDLYSLREAREAELQNSEAARAKAAQTRDRELEVMRQADHVGSAPKPVFLGWLWPHTERRRGAMVCLGGLAASASAAARRRIPYSRSRSARVNPRS